MTVADRTGVLVVTLDRPPANALNRALIRSLTGLFAGFAAEPDAPPVMLTGHGDRFFTAGGDIKELEGAAHTEIGARMRDFHALLVAMDRFPRPVVCAVNGHCVGGGMEIALFADRVLAVEHAQFGFPEINHGLLPADKGIQRAGQVLGTRRAGKMLLSGELFDAHRAREIGLVDTITGPGELLDQAVACALAAGSKAPVLYGALKQSLNAPDDTRDEAYLHRTIASAAAYFDDPAARERRENWKKN
ncbi:enoyl-CoA hydratase/isomerase family protein [Nocardia fusca]|uniref:enoyl-CoA hydratase/isomerase family protein n=1 Tax=Nocardia fusca TaxID=941183 RepID=UPI0007C7F1B0|nr:enoyl-CoA hydratase/isomerase family protein [Nocardia fusca]